MSKPLQPLDPTWWRRVAGTHRYEQQDGRATIHKLRTGRKVTGWAIYVYEAGNTWLICEYRSFEQAKRRAHEITSDPTKLAELRGQATPTTPLQHVVSVVCDVLTDLPPVGCAFASMGALGQEALRDRVVAHRVATHPDSAHHVHHAKREQQAPGAPAPTLIDRGLAARSDRHGGRSEEVP